MRNLKKILSLALALVMTLSVMSFASAATSFGDADEINANYAEAVDVLSGLKVFVGDTNDDFNPKDNISRAEVAAVIYRIATQDVTNAQIEMYATSDYFDDVTPDKWFAGYVNYCANATYIKGTGARDFEPYGEVTGYQVLAMILRAAGYDANGEFTGADWQIKVASTSKELGIIDTVTDVRLDQPVTREVVAELLFQTLQNVQKVRYTNAFGYIPYGDVLGKALFGLDTRDTTDAWGRPGTEWYATKPGNKEYNVVTYNKTPVYTATTKVFECDIAKEVGFTKTAAIEAAYIDGETYTLTDEAVTTNNLATINPVATTSAVGAVGRQLEVYDMGANGYRLVEINTYLAKVQDVTADTTDRNGHVTPGYTTLTVYTNAISKPVADTNTNVGIFNVADPANSVTESVTAYSDNRLRQGQLCAGDRQRQDRGLPERCRHQDRHGRHHRAGGCRGLRRDHPDRHHHHRGRQGVRRRRQVRAEQPRRCDQDL
jgi:hypothetical protein